MSMLLLPVLTSLLVAADAPWIASPPRITVAVMGQSYLSKSEVMTAAFAHGGHTLNWGWRGTIAGADVTWYHGTVEKSASKPSAILAKGGYDVFGLTPNLRQWNGSDDDFAKKREAVRFYLDVVTQANPRALIVCNTLWPRQEDAGAERRAWIDRNRAMVLRIVDEYAASRDPKHGSLRLNPRGEAIEYAYEWIRAGQVPGLPDWRCMYADGGHCGLHAQYINGILEAAVMTNASPLGMPARIPGASGAPPYLELTPEQADVFQRAALKALYGAPRTGFTVPADTTPPPAPGQPVVATNEPGRVVLTWPAVTDAESGIFRYVVTRSDGRIADTPVPTFIDTTISEGTATTWTIAAENFAGQLGAGTTVQKTIASDHNPPRLVQATAIAPDRIAVTFDEPLAEQLDAHAWQLDGKPVCAVAFVDAGRRLVEVTTTALGQTDHRLTVTGLRDASRAGNVLAQAESTIRWTPPTWTPFDLDGWDGTRIEQRGDSLQVVAQLAIKRPPMGTMAAMAGVTRAFTGDFTYTVAITSQEKDSAPLTGLVLARNAEELGRYDYIVAGVQPDQGLNLWATASFVGATHRKIDSKGERGASVDFPCWLRLVRQGSTISAQVRWKKATTWTAIGSIDATALPDTVLVGPFHSVGQGKDGKTAPNAAMFDLSGRDDAASFTGE
jgi:hypothetical protein